MGPAAGMVSLLIAPDLSLSALISFSGYFAHDFRACDPFSGYLFSILVKPSGSKKNFGDFFYKIF